MKTDLLGQKKLSLASTLPLRKPAQFDERPVHSSRYFDTWASTSHSSSISMQRESVKLVQTVGNDAAYILNEEDRKRFAEFHGAPITCKRFKYLITYNKCSTSAY